MTNIINPCNEALTHQRAGRLDVAESLYREILARDESHAEAHHNLGVIEIELGRHESGLAHLRLALQLAPGMGGYWLSLAEGLLVAQQIDEACSVMERAKAIGLNTPAALALRERLAIEQTKSVAVAEPSSSAVPLWQQRMVMDLLRQRQFAEGEVVARRLTEHYPQDAFGWKVAGTILFNRQQYQAALTMLLRAIGIAPCDAECLNTLGNTLHNLGRLNEAIDYFNRALETSTAAVTEPSSRTVPVWQQRRVVDFLRQKQFTEGEGAARRLTERYPDDAFGWKAAGTVFFKRQQYQDALIMLLRAIGIDPRNVECLNTLGNTLQSLGRLNEALDCFNRALEIDPEYAAAHNSKGVTLKNLKRQEEAVSSYQQAIKFDPHLAEAHNNLGSVFSDIGRLDDALACIRRSLAINPDFADAYNNLAGPLQEQGRLDEALTAYDRAINLEPELAAIHSNRLFVLNYHPEKSAEDIFAAYRDFDRRFGDPHRSSWQAHGNDLNPQRRLRIGYVSPDFNKHSARHFLEPLLIRHDKSEVDITAYAELTCEDTVTARYRRHVDHWVKTCGMTDGELSARIRADGIDILVELAGHTGNNRLGVFARRPAPVSISWMGYGYTTGLSAIDYFLSDEVMVPAGSEGLFAEQPWRIAVPSLVYRPAEDMGEVGPLPASSRGFITFGTLSRGIRINHRTIRVWAALLKRLPESRLVIDSKAFVTQSMQTRMAEQFAAHGIGPERLDIGYHSPPWDVLRSIDIGLDCFPHNSGTTLIESLYMGVPFITLAERPSVGRIGSLILSGAGHDEWIATTEDEYIEKTLALAGDLAHLAAIRAGLRAELETGSWRDEVGFARRVEQAYREMWRRWCAETDKPDETLSSEVCQSSPGDDSSGRTGYSPRPKRLSSTSSQRTINERDEVNTPSRLASKKPRRGPGSNRKPTSAAAVAEQQAVIALYEGGKLTEAQAAAQRLTERYPHDAFGWKVLGIAYLDGDQLQDALSAFNRSLEFNPRDAATLNSLGNALKRLGRLDEALDQYRRALKFSPSFAEAHNNLGTTLQSLGRYDEALETLRQATTLKADFAQAWHNMGNVLCDLGHHAEALECFERASQLKPGLAGVDHGMGIALRALGRLDEALASFRREPEAADVYRDLGNVLCDLGRHDEAMDDYRRALAINHEDADAHNNLGSVLRQLGRLEEALDHHLYALKLQPADANACNNAGLAMQDLGRLDDAETHYRQALALNPDLAEAHGNLGNLWQEFGRFGDALTCYQRVIAIKPHSPDAYNSMGLALMALGRLEEARACFETALGIKPDHVYARIDLGNVLQHQGKLDDALACLDQALSLKPDQAVGWNNRGNVFRDLERIDDALSSFNQAQRFKPNEAATLINRGNVLASMGRLDDALADYVSALAIDPDFPMALSNTLFALNYHPDKPAEEIFAAYRDFDRRFGEPHRASWTTCDNDRDPARRLRIGYVSPDFRSHSSRHFLEPLLAHHDPSQVELTAYAELAREDAVTARYRGYVDRWVATRGLTDDALAERIRADGIDILIDVAGHTASNRLGVFARRPAPVSVSWMGYGYTTGLRAIDYFLSDPVMVPAGSEHLFAERPWRIAVPSLVYRPGEGMGDAGPLPALKRGYPTFGTLTRSVRINHRTIRVWAAILQQVPDSRLVVDSKDFATAAMQQMLTERFAAHGIGPERLVIGCHSPPWDVLRGIDIGLDCFPHNSGTTLIESLYMGVPFITLAERPSVGRIGSLILAGAGHGEWIADSEDAYIDKAVVLASDLARLAAIRAGLRAELERGPWRDEAGFARRIEQAYREMWRRWCERKA